MKRPLRGQFRPAVAPPPPHAVGARYRVTINSFGQASSAKIGRILDEFFPEQFPRSIPIGEPPIIAYGGFASAEGLRLELTKVKAAVGMEEVV